jgi:hypothetical protein
MENKASFDLNSEIARWRAELDQSGALAADNLDELEGHLRDSVQDLQSRGLSDEEAFMVAGRRVGSSRALVSEFSKVRANQVWIDRTLWIVVGHALFQAFWSLQQSTVMSSTTAFTYPRSLLFWIAPVVLAMLTLRSIVRGAGWTPRTLNSLARTPLKLSAAFLCLGLGTIAFRALALSSSVTNRVFPGTYIAAVSAANVVFWIVLSLMIYGVARARVHRAAT